MRGAADDREVGVVGMDEVVRGRFAESGAEELDRPKVRRDPRNLRRPHRGDRASDKLTFFWTIERSDRLRSAPASKSLLERSTDPNGASRTRGGLAVNLNPGHPGARRWNHEAEVRGVRDDKSPAARSREADDRAPVTGPDALELDLEAVVGNVRVSQ
jgi:hypothetical protein